MNYRFVIQQLGLVLLVLAACMLGISAWVALTWTPAAEPEMVALFTSIGVGGSLGTLMWFFGRSGQNQPLGRREALLVVGLSWLVGAALSGLPYLLWAYLAHLPGTHPFHSAAACYFEAMSGLTTTGATTLLDVDSVPRGLLLWRATTHWLGGLGIVVLFVAVLPTIGVGGKRLYNVEAPGLKQQGVRPRIRETARVLWFIYLAMTVAQTVALRLAGMTWFDAVCHTFATLATGGFSSHNASIGYYDAWSIDLIVIVFMVLAGVNFGLYYQLARGRWKDVWRDPEARLYLAILAVATLVVSAAIYGSTLTWSDGRSVHADAATTVRAAAFQVVSIQTTTGFGTADFDSWPFIAQAVLVALMFVGACAGSTGGGIKVIRVLIAVKVILVEIERVFRPSVVRTIRVGSGVVSPELRQSVLVYILSILLLFLLGSVAIMLSEAATAHELDFTTAATASAATLNNIGPGLARVGPLQNYAFFNPGSKIIMSLLMALGRLELYAILVLPLPSFWRRY